METNKLAIESLSDFSAFIIFTDGVSYFIPGQREDSCYADLFDALTSNYFPHFDVSLGAGWLFGKEAIEKIKKDFEEHKVNYAEMTISRITLHRHI